MKRVFDYGIQLLGSRWFFYFVAALFVLQASQLVLTSALPMAFDEGYHFQIVQFFSHYWHPFISSQPPETYGQGAIVHNPSFLYHFVLSFPYRLTAVFTDNVAVQVMVLRFINVGLAVGSLFVLRRLFQGLRVSALPANITLFLVALTPMFTALSAQINYDNAVVLLAAVVGYYMVKLLSEKQLRADTLLLLLAFCLLGCVVKFSFLPILCAVFLLTAVVVVVRWRRNGRQALFSGLRTSFWAASIRRKLTVGLVVLVGAGLCASFYGYALVHYRTPVPQCDQILSVEACKNYYAWNRNYEALNNTNDAPTMNIFAYTALWVRATYYHLFAELLPLGGIVAVQPTFFGIIMTLTAFAATCTLFSLRTLLGRHPGLAALGLIALLYLLALWGRNYFEYVRFGEWVAVQGRYLVPFIACLYLLLVLGAVYWLRGLNQAVRGSAATVAVAVLLGSFLYYGGSAQYVAHVTPNHNWYTPDHASELLAGTSPVGYPPLLAETHVGTVFALSIAGAAGAAYLPRRLYRSRRAAAARAKAGAL